MQQTKCPPYIGLLKVPSSYSLSPQRGERVRVRGEKKPFGQEYNLFF
jgi:hypothetical protein